MLGVVLVFSAASAAVAATPGTLTVRLGGSAAIGRPTCPSSRPWCFGMTSYKYIAGIKAGSPSTRVLGYKSAIEMADDCGSSGRRRRATPASPTRRRSPTTPPLPSDPWVAARRGRHSLTTAPTRTPTWPTSAPPPTRHAGSATSPPPRRSTATTASTSTACSG